MNRHAQYVHGRRIRMIRWFLWQLFYIHVQ
jgi:hypothetical protein